MRPALSHILGTWRGVFAALPWLLLACTAAAWAAAIPPPGGALELEPGQEVLRLGAHLAVLEDPDGTLSLAQVASTSLRSRFQPVNDHTINLGVSASTFWFRFHLRESGPAKGQAAGGGWILDLGQPSLAYAELYVNEAAGWRKLETLSRDLRPFPPPSRYAVFRLPTQPEETRVYYLRLRNTSVNSMDPRIYSPEGFLAQNRRQLWFLGAYCGAILALAIYNLVVFFSLGDRSYLWYVFTIISLAIYYLGWNGLVQDYLRFLPPNLNRHLPIAFLSVLFLCRGQFARYFLLTKTAAPVLDKVILWSSLGLGLLTVMVPISSGGTRLLAIQASAAAAIGWPWLLLFVAWRRWRQGFQPALYFMLVFPLTAVSQLIFMLIILKALPFSDTAFFSHQIASYFEPVLLALALGYRIRSLRREKRGAEQTALETEKRHRLVMESAPNPLAVSDPAGRLTYVNPAFQRVFGYDAGQALGRSLAELILPAAAPPEEAMRQALEVGGAAGAEGCCRTREGEALFVSLSTAAFRGADGQGGGRVIMLQDVSQRKRAEAELKDNQKRLRQLALELSTAEERQRRRIAEDLHDGASQSLATSVFSLKRLRSRLSGEPHDELDRICGVLDQSLGDIRSLTFEISPPVLYDYGLAAALEWLAEQVADKHGLVVEFSEEGEALDLDQDRQANVFRACQELLINAVKHAGARRVGMRLARRRRRVEVEVRDDGKGFDPAAGQNHGFGLFSLRERLEAMGGKLTVESRPGQGSSVTLSLPAEGPGRA